MVESLLGGGSLDPDVLDRVVTRGGGQPAVRRSSCCGCSSTRAFSSARTAPGMRPARCPTSTSRRRSRRCSPRVSTRSPGRARGDRARIGRRLRVRGGRRVGARPARRVSPRVADRAHDARPEALRPARRGGRRGAPSLPAHHDPRYRVRRHPQARAGRPPRAVRRLGRRGQPRPRRGIRGDPRLPPRAGVDVPLRARPARRPRPRDRRGRRTPAGVGRAGAPSPEATFLPRRRCSAARPRFCRRTTPSGSGCFPSTARRCS